MPKSKTTQNVQGFCWTQPSPLRTPSSAKKHKTSMLQCYQPFIIFPLVVDLFGWGDISDCGNEVSVIAVCDTGASPLVNGDSGVFWAGEIETASCGFLFKLSGVWVFSAVGMSLDSFSSMPSAFGIISTFSFWNSGFACSFTSCGRLTGFKASGLDCSIFVGLFSVTGISIFSIFGKADFSSSFSVVCVFMRQNVNLSLSSVKPVL